MMKHMESGFNYLYDVQRDSAIKDSFCVDWKVKDTWHVWENREMYTLP